MLAKEKNSSLIPTLVNYSSKSFKALGTICRLVIAIFGLCFKTWSTFNLWKMDKLHSKLVYLSKPVKVTDISKDNNSLCWLITDITSFIVQTVGPFHKYFISLTYWLLYLLPLFLYYETKFSKIQKKPKCSRKFLNW